MKPGILDKLSLYLLRKGFTIKILTRTCFDVLARKEAEILLVKILEDANSISQEYAQQMNYIASYVGASPLIISEKAGHSIEDNVVYSRFGIYTLNFATFKFSLENKFPFIKSDHAGLTAHIIGYKIRHLREQLGLSLGDIARKIGVSKHMVQRYEKGEADVTINKALKLYDIFGHKVFEKIDILQTPDKQAHELKSDVGKKYSDLGFDALETKKVPFDIIAKKEKELILTRIGDRPQPQLDSLSKLVDADKLVIFKKKRPKDIPALTKKEFMDFEKSRELVKFLKDF